MQVCGGTDYADPNLGLNLGHLNLPLSTQHWLIWADFYAHQSINAVQEQYARIEEVTMMHMDHAVPI